VRPLRDCDRRRERWAAQRRRQAVKGVNRYVVDVQGRDALEDPPRGRVRSALAIGVAAGGSAEDRVGHALEDGLRNWKTHPYKT
jgi:hypothetical protein